MTWKPTTHAEKLVVLRKMRQCIKELDAATRRMPRAYKRKDSKLIADAWFDYQLALDRLASYAGCLDDAN